MKRKKMTPEERDRMDIEYLESLTEEPDMSPQAVTERMIKCGELCEISRKIGVSYIRFYGRPTIDPYGSNN